MEILKNKFLNKLIISICLFLTLFNFGISNTVYAGWGGKLLSPIINLFVACGDSIMEIMHESVQAQDAAILKIDGSESWYNKLATVLAIVAGIVLAIVVIAIVVATAGGAAAGAAALVGASAKAAFVAAAGKAAVAGVAAGAVAGTIAGVAVKEKMIPEDIYLPAFSITAEEIFRNDIYLFDVNFFSENKYTITKNKTENIEAGEKVIINETGSTENETDLYDLFNRAYDQHEVEISEFTNQGIYITLRSFIDEINSHYKNIIPTGEDSDWYVQYQGISSSNPTREGLTEYIMDGYFRIFDGNNNCVFDIAYYRVAEYAVNCTWTEKVTVRVPRGVTVETNEKEEVEIESTAQQLKGVVSKWYFILRNLAILVLMLVLIYTGIRIVIGSTAGEKAKYKERLMDWLVAMCLLFIMHYIMAFAVEIVESITDLIGRTVNGNQVYLELTETQSKNAKKVLVDFNTIGDAMNEDKIAGAGAIAYYDENENRLKSYNDEGIEVENHGVLIWPTDLAGLFRIQSQLTEDGTSLWVGYSLCYFILVLFTLFFAFTYLKRVLYMAFLTMIAPLVAMTYPIDKMTDGKAQAFDAWLKEYIFNLMIQPLHLLLYTVLVSSAFTLATESPVYALIAVGFMMPAEKLMRRFFGFEKAKTPGLLGGAAGAALAMTGLQKLVAPKHKGGRHDSGGAGKEQEQTKVKFANKNKVNAMDAIAGEQPSGNSAGAAVGLANSSRNSTTSQGDASSLASTGAPANASAPRASNSASNSALNSGTTRLSNSSLQRASGATSENKKKRHLARAVGRASLGVGKKMAAGALRGIHPLRLAGRLAAGATVGTAGLMLGIASGDPTKAFQYTTGGAMAGSALAGSLAGTGSNLFTNEDIEDIRRSYYGEDYSEAYKQRIMEEQRETLEGRGNVNYLMQMMAVDREQAKEILETTGQECFDTGITNIEDIATIHQLTHGDDAMSFEKAVAARSYAQKRLGGADIDQMTAEKVEEYKKRWADEFKERYQHLNDVQARELANRSFDAAIRFNKAKSGLTKI